MATDQLVSARDVLASLQALRRPGGGCRALVELERREPDLAEFVLEDLTAIHHHIWATGASRRAERRRRRRVESLALVIHLSVGEAHRRPWQEANDDAPTAGIARRHRTRGTDANSPELDAPPAGHTGRELIPFTHENHR